MKKAKTRSTAVLFDHTMSASTLARKAAALEKAGKKKQAQTLRDRAARLRRDARGAKHKMTGLPDREAIIKRVNQRISDGTHVAGLDSRLMQPDEAANDAGRAASVDHTPLANAPGHGEIVGGYLASKAKELAELARKKGGVDSIQRQLAVLEAQARHDEQYESGIRERRAKIETRAEMRDKAVCGFIAVFDTSVSTGMVPPACIMSADMLHNIVDTLKANGYRADGKR